MRVCVEKCVSDVSVPAREGERKKESKKKRKRRARKSVCVKERGGKRDDVNCTDPGDFLSMISRKITSSEKMDKESQEWVQARTIPGRSAEKRRWPAE